MTQAELEAAVSAELDRRGIPHQQGMSVVVKEERFLPSIAPDESILGRIKIGAQMFFATLKSIAATKVVKVTLWLVLTAIPTAEFYFPSQYAIAKQLALATTTQVIATFDIPASKEYGHYIIVNAEWKVSEAAYEEDRTKYFSNLPTGSLSVPVSAYPSPVASPDFTISGSFNI